MAAREQFSSRTGFILAAAGSAIGLGNIWGFPTQTASNGGGAFVVVYLLMAFCLAYPALMAELIIGRHSRSNIVSALCCIASNRSSRAAGTLIGLWGVIVASLILSFYAIVAGWMLAYMADALLRLIGMQGPATWLVTFSIERNLLTMGVFMALTMAIIAAGISSGIEKWSTRLMPALLLLMLLLIAYVMTREGAMTGLRLYLVPDFSQLQPGLILSAMGQAFFSLSLGVGTMLIYGSYLSHDESLPKLGAAVTLVDTGVAFLAGLLILPAIYVAQHNGVNIFTDDGSLIAGPDLIFQVLPVLFGTMGQAGTLVALAFFVLMSIAALTSSISMLEVPVSLAVEETSCSRAKATLFTGALIFVASTIILFNFDALFGLVITVTTVYSQPLLGLCLCVFAGWIWHRNHLLMEVRKGHPQIEKTWFWKIWPVYVKFACPVLILANLIHSLAT